MTNAITGLMFNKHGDEIGDVRLELPHKVGGEVTVHMGHGRYCAFKVVAKDETHALLGYIGPVTVTGETIGCTP